MLYVCSLCFKQKEGFKNVVDGKDVCVQCWGDLVSCTVCLGKAIYVLKTKNDVSCEKCTTIAINLYKAMRDARL